MNLHVNRLLMKLNNYEIYESKLVSFNNVVIHDVFSGMILLVMNSVMITFIIILLALS